MAEVSAMAALDPPVEDADNALETSSTPSPCTSQAVQQQEQLIKSQGRSLTDELNSVSQAPDFILGLVTGGIRLPVAVPEASLPATAAATASPREVRSGRGLLTEVISRDDGATYQSSSPTLCAFAILYMYGTSHNCEFCTPSDASIRFKIR